MTGIQLAPPPNPYSDQLAQALMQQGQIDGPIITPMQGIGKLAQALAGALLHKKYGEDKTAYEQQHSQAVNDALMKALTHNPSIFGTEDPSKIPMPSMDTSNPLIAAGKALASDPTTLDQSNQFLAQALMSQNKQDNKPNETWVDLTQQQKKDRGYNEYQAIREKVVDGKPTGETQAVGSPQFDPSQMTKQQTTFMRDSRGNLVKRVVNYNKAADVISTDDEPAIESPLPPDKQKEYEGISSTAAISNLMRYVMTEGAGTNWNGPISGPLNQKLQQFGFDKSGGTYAEAFAALKSHYILALTQLAGSNRGKWILDQLDKITPESQFSTQRNLMQLDLTDGLLHNKAANIVKGYANTKYSIPQDLWDMGQVGGYDPQHPEKVIKDYMPSISGQLSPQDAPPNSEIRTAPNGKKYYFDKSTKKNLGEVGG